MAVQRLTLYATLRSFARQAGLLLYLSLPSRAKAEHAQAKLLSKGNDGLISMSQVEAHDSLERGVWVVIEGEVYE